MNVFHNISEKITSLTVIEILHSRPTGLQGCIFVIWLYLKTFFIVCISFFSLLINQLVSKLNNLTILFLKMHFQKSFAWFICSRRESGQVSLCSKLSPFQLWGCATLTSWEGESFQVSGFCSAPFTSLHTSGGAESQTFQQQLASFSLLIEVADALDLGRCSNTAEPSAQPLGFKGVHGFNLKHMLS